MKLEIIGSGLNINFLELNETEINAIFKDGFISSTLQTMVWIYKRFCRHAGL